MIERHFDEELEDLKKHILEMGYLVEDAVRKSVEALKQMSREQARTVIIQDSVIDELELDIDDICYRLLALRQPLAADLRFITMAMNITTDLERIADLAVNIAERVLELVDKPLLKPLIDIPKLTDTVLAMIHDIISAFVNKDTNLARNVIMMDSLADDLRDAVQKELINDYMEKDPSTASRAVPLLLIARHLERIGDHATNIAEEIIYLFSAQVVKHHPENLRG
jgi:phosphate transport system protein